MYLECSTIEAQEMMYTQPSMFGQGLSGASTIRELLDAWGIGSSGGPYGSSGGNE